MDTPLGVPGVSKEPEGHNDYYYLDVFLCWRNFKKSLIKSRKSIKNDCFVTSFQSLFNLDWTLAPKHIKLLILRSFWFFDTPGTPGNPMVTTQRRLWTAPRGKRRRRRSLSPTLEDSVCAIYAHTYLRERLKTQISGVTHCREMRTLHISMTSLVEHNK